VARACETLVARPVEPSIPARLLAVAHRADRPLEDGDLVVLDAVRRAASEMLRNGALVSSDQ
jgi:hypothetical protein